MRLLGIRTYADLNEVNVAEPPDVWDGKDWSKVKRRDLRGRNLAFADGAGAFLANTDLRGANLTGADLSGAQLQGADLGRAQLDGAELSDAQLQGADFGGAQLQGAELGDTQLQDAELGRAQLQGADLGRARLQGANVSLAKLQGANLSGAELQGANLSGAELQGADLGPAERRARAGLTFISAETAFFRPAQLQGADLRAARLEGANLSGAELQGAYLRGAWLQGTDLSYAQLQAADLHYARIWRARVNDTLWDLADLGGSTVQPITDSEIDALIGEAIKGIPDEERRKVAAERLNTGLRTEDRPARPDLEWRSEPYVMFDQVPFLRQALRQIEQAYDEDLATYLGDLACASDVPEAQTRGLARRALDDANRARLFAQRLAARLIGSDCPPAKGLADDMRRQLEQLAARGVPAGASPGTAPPDAVK